MNSLQKLAVIVTDKTEKNQYSEAASRARDVITYVATQEKALMKASEFHFPAALVEGYSALMIIEYDIRKNYGKVVEVFNELVSKYSHALTLGIEILQEENMSNELKLLQLL